MEMIALSWRRIIIIREDLPADYADVLADFRGTLAKICACLRVFNLRNLREKITWNHNGTKTRRNTTLCFVLFVKSLWLNQKSKE